MGPLNKEGNLRIVWIRPRSPQYDSVIESVEGAYRGGTLGIFVGAGISMPGPSCVPGGEAIRDRLLRAMTEALQSHGFGAEADRLRVALGSRPIELLLDAFTKVHGRQAIDMLASLNVRQINKNHYCIARLAEANRNTRIISLNFDVLIEIALEQLECPYVVRCPLGEDAVPCRHHPGEVVEILKPHGSFALPGYRHSTENLATTLTEIRDRPDERTAKAVSELLVETSTLIVIGYRGEDWDVLPLIARSLEANAALRLVWVQYCSDETEKSDTFIADCLCRGVKEVIHAYGRRVTLLAGEPSVLLADLLTRIRPEKNEHILPVISCGTELLFEATTFLDSTGATVLSAAHAMQDVTRGDTDRILAYLATDPVIRSNPQFDQSYANLAAWRHHIRAGPSDYAVGIALRESALRTNRKRGLSDEMLAPDLISTGYQYLSYAKPRRSHLRHPLRFLRHWWIGRRYLARGAAVGSQLQKGRAAYYRADYRHAFWMPLLLFGHDTLSSLRRAIFKRLVCRGYDRAGREQAHLMDREYFYLRRIEAEIIAGAIRDSRSDLDRQLAHIETYFMITRQIDHLRNVYATKALLAFSSDPSDPAVDRYLACAFFDKRHLSKMESVKDLADGGLEPSIALLVEWVSKSADDITLTPSGFKRYSLFLRFMRPRQLSFSDALQRLS